MRPRRLTPRSRGAHLTRRLEIDASTSLIARDAMRDILYLYWDLATSYRGFGHGIDTGRFDPYACLGAVVADPGYAGVASVDVLRRGAAIKILCLVSDHLDDHDAAPTPGTWLGCRLQDLLDAGQLDHVAEAKLAITRILAGDHDGFRDQLGVVYDAYVVGALRALTEGPWPP